MRKALGARRALPTNEEAQLQNRILARFGATPGVLILVNTVKVIPSPYGPGSLTFGLGEGSPDLVGSVDVDVTLANDRAVTIARFACWELKVPGNHPEPHQTRLHEAWRRLGIFVAVVHSEEEFAASIERARCGEMQ